MTRGRKPEPTLPGNPRQLTINQHVHSKWCIEKFADKKGRVGVVRRGEAPFKTNASNPIFCAQRAWSQKLECSLFCKVEHEFHAVVATVLSGAPVSDHDAVTGYIAIWQQRSRFAKEPPEDVTLNGVRSPNLNKEEEETLESRGYGFLRENVVPGRIAAHITALRAYDIARHKLAGTRWGVVTAPEGTFPLSRRSPGRALHPDIPQACAARGLPGSDVADHRGG